MARIDELLELSYRSGDLGNHPDPLDEAVYIILSAQTREPIYQSVYAQLRAVYPRWRDVLKASNDDLVAILRPGGFQNQRAAKLHALLAAVDETLIARFPDRSRREDLSLDFLRTMSDSEAYRVLESFPGIGPKSAKCIMSYSLGRESFAVDTHVRRILERLEIIERRTGKPAYDNIEALVPARRRVRLHVNLVHHGRVVCTSQRPNCDRCVLVSFCPAGRETVAAEAAAPRAIELFAGAGGLGLGFHRAGFSVVLAVERDRDPAQTYRLNHPGTPVLEADVALVDEGDLRELAPLDDLTAVLAGTPCQGYSHAGRRDPDDPANLLYLEVARFAKLLQPELVVLENVPGVRRVNGVSFEDRIRTAIEEAGYSLSGPAPLRASEFGVPQNRVRLVYLARRSDLGSAPTAPLPTHRPPGGEAAARFRETPTLESVLADLPPLGAGVVLESGVHCGRAIYNASTMAHSARVLEKIASIEPGNGPISYRRLERDVARTLVAGHRALPVHPWLHRTISVREAARIQGFPDDFIFAGTRANQPLQVANAVPPLLAEAVARHLLACLKLDGKDRVPQASAPTKT